MPGDAAHRLRATYDEYLAQERASDVRLEYWAGEIFAMAGGTPAHSRVKLNLAGLLFTALQNKPCLALDSDQKLDIADADLATYPDLTVICGPLVRSPRDRNALVNPTLVVELLSPTTEGRDLGDKRRAYQRLASMRQMLFVSPEARAIELWTRNDDGSWTTREQVGDEIVLDSIDARFARLDVFTRVDEVEVG